MIPESDDVDRGPDVDTVHISIKNQNENQLRLKFHRP